MKLVGTGMRRLRSCSYHCLDCTDSLSKTQLQSSVILRRLLSQMHVWWLSSTKRMPCMLPATVQIEVLRLPTWIHDELSIILLSIAFHKTSTTLYYHDIHIHRYNFVLTHASIPFRAGSWGGDVDIWTERLCPFHRTYLHSSTWALGNQKVLRLNRYSKILMNNKNISF